MAITLYHNEYSGHSHRVRLFLSLLGLKYQSVHLDIRKGEQKTPDYLKLNPLGQVPTLVDGDDIIADSSAALVYLAKKYDNGQWLPVDPAGAAQVQVWLSTAAGELYRGPATARAIKLGIRNADYDDAKQCAERLFHWMQQELSQHNWLVTDHATIADIAMYSYTRIADEGELDLTLYGGILRWLEDVEKLAGFEAMPRIKK